MLKNLSSKNVGRALSKLAMAPVLVMLIAISASAYTLVFRDGRRMEIPDEFTVTRNTVSYEIAPGFSKTMQMALIDVAATERANHEAPGSFFKHKEETPTANDPAPQAVRTLTDRDLAAVRQRRIESEQTYETRRKELGLPTVEATRLRQATEDAALREQIREANLAKAREESYWRQRARDLRLEIATVDTQISYLRGRIGELNENSLNDLVITEVYPIWPNQRRGGPYYPNAPWGLPRVTPGWGYPNIYGYPTGPNNNYGRSAQRAELTNRLDDLLVRRAGLSVQWRLLEDEARDARVPQVWLEP